MANEPTTPITSNYASPSAMAVPIFDLNSYRMVPGYAEQTTHRMGAWQAGLCDCCKHSIVPNCCMVTLCPCIALAQVFMRINCIGSYCIVLFFLFFPWFFSIAIAVFGIVRFQGENESTPQRHLYLVPIGIVLVWIWQGTAVCIGRKKVRAAFHLPEQEKCGDCVLSMWYTPCVIAQMTTHSQSYKSHTCSFGRPDTLQPFPVD